MTEIEPELELDEPVIPAVGPPTVDDVLEYLGGTTSWTEDQVTSAYLAEKSAQRSVCKVPAMDVEWPADLAEALCRRVAHNLALRGLPLGVQAQVSEMNATQMRVGGTDAEVRRLEGPYRKRVVG